MNRAGMSSLGLKINGIFVNSGHSIKLRLNLKILGLKLFICFKLMKYQPINIKTLPYNVRLAS